MAMVTFFLGRDGRLSVSGGFSLRVLWGRPEAAEPAFTASELSRGPAKAPGAHPSPVASAPPQAGKKERGPGETRPFRG
jgi:hypothetical protein